MATIITRAAKGTPLTHNEVDANFVNLNTAKLEASTTATLTNKTINLTSNTLVATSAQLRTAVTDETGTGSLVFGTSPTITGGTINATTLQEGSVAAVVQTDIGTAPNEIPLNQYLGELAYMNAESLVITPPASVDPNGIGDMVFQLTSDTSLVVKVKGSDGTVRSTTLTLAQEQRYEYSKQFSGNTSQLKLGLC